MLSPTTSTPPWRTSARRALRVLLALVVTACASGGATQSFAFSSNLDVPGAWACVVDHLGRLGFDVVESSREEATVLALRRAPPRAARAPEWWQVEVRVETGEEGITRVGSEAGAAGSRDGPFREPPAQLQSLVGELAARCAWPR
ncbi:MAG TPA: hypothetical protein VFQ22_13235 [Longimicrobiales bacterium]|nr:hypothetical protein [Longimicrobiales bacterium]